MRFNHCHFPSLHSVGKWHFSADRCSATFSSFSFWHSHFLWCVCSNFRKALRLAMIFQGEQKLADGFLEQVYLRLSLRPIKGVISSLSQHFQTSTTMSRAERPNNFTLARLYTVSIQYLCQSDAKTPWPCLSLSKGKDWLASQQASLYIPYTVLIAALVDWHDSILLHLKHCHHWVL